MIGDIVKCDECVYGQSGCDCPDGACSHPAEDENDRFISMEVNVPLAVELTGQQTEKLKEYGDGEVTTDGLKYDVQKVDMSFLEYFPLALEQVCGLSEFGAKKYTRGGFRGITDPKRCKAAMLRHYFKESAEDVDPDSGFAHDVAVAWNALAALEIRLMNSE